MVTLTKRFSLLLCTLYSVLCTAFCGCSQLELYKDTRLMMGTVVEVASEDKAAGPIVFTEIQRIEDLLSKYKQVSEVYQLNQSGKLKVSPETFYILKKSIEFWKLSGGAFDVTSAVLSDLWGFSNKEFRLPTQEEINQALKLVGSDKIILHTNDNMVEFSIPGMKIDLGAIAKGFALDCAVAKLKAEGINSCLINAGGQVYALGTNHSRPWKVAMKDPRSAGALGFFELEDKSVSTSGDYEQFFMSSGKRLSHIFDPRTGYPAESGVLSVSVVAAEGLVADALSTAIFVLGKDKGLELAKKFPGVELKIFEAKDVQGN